MEQHFFKNNGGTPSGPPADFDFSLPITRRTWCAVKEMCERPGNGAAFVGGTTPLSCENRALK